MASTGGMYKEFIRCRHFRAAEVEHVRRLSPLVAACAWTQEMVFDTYHIFDPYDDGRTGVVRTVAVSLAGRSSYATLLQRPSSLQQSQLKAVTLMKKYNTDNKGGIDIHEMILASWLLPVVRLSDAKGMFGEDGGEDAYRVFVLGPSNRVRARLASVGSELKVVKLRAEVASAIVDYLTLVASKNLTKVGWVTGRLVSGELPLEFTADVFYELYKAKTDSNNMSPIDVGSLIINYTLHENPAQVIAAVDLIADPAFFAGEGFDITIADETVSQVVSWIEMSDWGKAALLKLAKVKPSNGQTFAEAYDEEVKAREVKYSTANGLGSPEANSYHTQAAQTLRNVLLGGPAASSGSNDPEAAQASGSAQPAKPQTLKFAAELSVNVSQSVKDFNEQCYQYSGSSSNPLDSTCNSINGMIKKTQSFLTLMNNYAGPGGPEFIEKQADDFINGSLQDMVLLSGELIDEGIASVQCSAGNAAACKLIRDTDYTMHLSGATTFLTDTMKDLQSSLPQVIKALTTAKKEVSTISGVINSISQMLGLKAPPLMDQMGMIYKIVWIAYFVFFFLFSATMLFYGFWANGWFGGPQADLPESEYQPPQTFVERIRTCCGSCLACCRSCTSGHLCFWSMLLLAQVIVLLMFIISLVICLITGIQAFFGAGCSKIYLIGDAEVCSAVLGIFKVFLKTFGFEEPIEDTCFQKNLLTCKIIRDSVFHTAIFVIIGALLASVFSFQMLLDSAIKHERARCARIWEEEGLDKKSRLVHPRLPSQPKSGS
ncbi:GIP [Symbiodinium sp. CCMP2592]|nr:GIP [Symbiodinium sp. CCMP2592]